MANNETIKILNGDKIVVNVNTFRHFINELIDRRIKGKGLSTNDFTNEDKTKLTSALTSTSIISADKVSGTLSNATINASKIIDRGGQGELITGVIGGDRIHGLLRNASVYGSRVDGKLTNANIDIERVNNLNDIIGSSSNGSEIYYYVKAERLSGISNATIIGSKVSGDLSRATISGSRIYDNINGTIISGAIKASRIQGSLVNAEIHANKIGDTINGTYVFGAIDGSRLRGNINNATLATGAVLPENIASGNLASGVKVNVNALVGYIPATRLQGNINKERMRSGFLELCAEYKVVRNNNIIGTN